MLLVHHNRFNRWVPPGGHLEPGETFSEAAARECHEETGLQVEVVSASPAIHPPDSNATPEPVPFYVDVEREGFRIPALVQFFYLRLLDASSLARAKAQESEVYGLGWFNADELMTLPTFDQVRSLSQHALAHHPDTGLNKII